MRDTELLSQLIEGELPVRESDELLARMETEPALAELYRCLQGLPGELAELPDEAPPRELDRALLEPAPGSRGWMPWTGWLVAAALLVLVAWPAPATELTLISGQQLVEGPARVLLAGGREVEVQGRALISVEPTDAPLRESGDKEDPMNPKLLIAAAAGAALTVSVYEGRALIHDGDAEPILVEQGQTHREAPPVAAEARRVVMNTDGAPPRTLSEAQDRIEQLEAELALASFSGQLKDGRLMALEGVPQDFPADLDPRHKPARFEQRLQGALALGEGELVAVDCSEFPCLVTLTTDAEGDRWDEGLRPIAEAMQADEDDRLSIWASGFQKDEDGPTANYWTFAVTPDAYAADEDLKQRTSFRSDAITEELSQSLDEQVTEDVDEEG